MVHSQPGCCVNCGFLFRQALSVGLVAVSLLACQVASPPSPTPGPRAATTAPRAGTSAPRAATPVFRQGTPTAGPRPNFAVNPAGVSFLAPAKPGGRVQLDESQLPFLLLFPELRTAAAPDWLQTGARVTYRVESATIPQVQGQQSASGAGYVQYDLVALEADLAVATSKLYLDSVDGAGVMPSLVFPVLGLPGVGEFWLNPQALANAEQVASNELSVTRMDKAIGADTFHAVRFEYTHGNAQYAWMFDEASGVLLFYSWSIGGDADPNRQLGQVTLAARRQLNLPWQAGTLPGWVAQTHRLHYTGTYGTTVTGASTVELSASAAVTLQDHFDHWNAYNLSGSVQGQTPSAAEHLTGGDEIFDGLWLAPEALAVLQDGQTLDKDLVTGATITVARDARTLTLTETGQRYQTSNAYDSSDGRLVETVQQQQIGPATIVTRLRLDSSN